MLFRSHGTVVTAVAAAVADNGVGIAGTGAPVVNVKTAQLSQSSMFDIVESIYATIYAGSTADILNISAAAPAPAIVGPLVTITEFALEALVLRYDLLIFACAGNVQVACCMMYFPAGSMSARNRD